MCVQILKMFLPQSPFCLARIHAVNSGPLIRKGGDWIKNVICLLDFYTYTPVDLHVPTVHCCLPYISECTNNVYLSCSAWYINELEHSQWYVLLMTISIYWFLSICAMFSTSIICWSPVHYYFAHHILHIHA